MARQPAKTAAAPDPAPAVPRQAPDPMAGVPRDGRAVALGRDGKPLFRQSQESHDHYALASELQPPGWVYQWMAYSVNGEVQYTAMSSKKRVGRWEEVPADRHPGVWLPVGHKGAIIVDGLVLMERPVELHIEAEREMKRQADGAVRKAKEERALAPKSAGIDVNTAAARSASFVREERLMSGGVGRDGLSDAEALAQTRGSYSYDRQID